MSEDVQVLLGTADRLLREAVPGTRGMWPRLVAFTVRAALELEIDAFWARVEPGVAGAPMRSKLLLLEAYTDPMAARSASELWHELSGATHHHAYDLAPTADELRTWYAAVVELRGQLAPAA